VIFADKVLLNGKIITMDDKKPEAEAVAILGDKIVAVGTNEEIKAYIGDKTEVLDMQGKCIVPGFIDAHNHMTWYAKNLMGIDCRSPPIKSIKEILDLVKAEAEKEDAFWIVGWGYDHNKLEERRLITRHDIDAVVKGKPVVLNHISGHFCSVNSKALELAGITDQTPDPPGGKIGKDENGEPDGILYEIPAIDLIRRAMPQLTSEKLKEAIIIASKKFTEKGITSSCDAGVGLVEDDIKAYVEAHKSGEFHVRMNLAITEEYHKEILKLNLQTGFGNEHIKIGPLKIWADGSLIGGTAAVREPYKNQPDNFGEMNWSEEELYAFFKKAHDEGFQIAVHAIGDRAIEIVLNLLEKIIKENPRKDHRHRIEHCGICPPDLLKRIRDLGIVVVTQPTFIYETGDGFTEKLPPERLRWTYPFRSLLEHGIVTAASSDCPVVRENPLLGIYSAVTRKTENGVVLSPEERISVYDALKMYTINAAYATFEEDIKGSIEPGKLADMVVLDKNILEVPEEEIKDIKVEMTIIGGEIVFKR